jgi:hypothetical protein
MRKLIAAAVVSALALYCYAAETKDKAADVEATIQKGLKAYKDGKPGEAIAALQDAIAAIQKTQEGGLAAFLPEAPDGWTADKAEVSSGAFGSGAEAVAITTLSRAYTRKSDDLRTRFTLTNSDKIVGSQKAMLEMFKNPDFLKTVNTGDNKFQTFEQDGWAGWTSVEKGRKAEMVAFCGAYMLNIAVEKDDAAALQTFIKGTNLKGLAGSAAATTKPAK